MDFDAMRTAYNNALEVMLKTEKDNPLSEEEIYELINRLESQHEVRYDPLCQEAANAIRHLYEKLVVTKMRISEMSEQIDVIDSSVATIGREIADQKIALINHMAKLDRM